MERDILRGNLERKFANTPNVGVVDVMPETIPFDKRLKFTEHENVKPVNLVNPQIPGLEQEVYVIKNEKDIEEKALKKLRRSIAEHTFETIVALSQDADLKPDIEKIKTNSESIIKQLKEKNLLSEENEKFLRRSFDKRTKILRKDLLKEELTNAGENGKESAWKKSAEVINQKLLADDPQKVKRDAALYEILRIEDKIADKVSKADGVKSQDKKKLTETLATYVANKISSELSDAHGENLATYKKEGIKKMVDNVFQGENKKKKGSADKFIEEKINSYTKGDFILPEEEKVLVEQTVEKTDKDSKNKHLTEAWKNQINLEKLALQTQLFTVLMLLAANQVRTQNSIALDGKQSVEDSKPGKTGWFSNKIIKAPALEPTNENYFDPKQLLGNSENGQRDTVFAAASPEQVKLIALATPEPPYYNTGIDFSIPTKTELTVIVPDYYPLGLDKKILTTSFTPLVHNDLFSPIQVADFLEKVKPGQNTAPVYIEGNGNTNISIHTGYFNGIPLEFQDLLIFIQGSTPDHPEKYYSDEETLKMLELMKEKGTIFRLLKDGVLREYRLAAAGKIPHGTAQDQFLGSAKDALNTAIEYTGGEMSEFNVLKSTKGILVDFCIPNIKEKGKNADWATWDTGVFALIPTSSSFFANEENNLTKKEAELSSDPIERFAEINSQVILESQLRDKDRGEKFGIFYAEYLKAFGVQITDRMESVITDTVIETKDKKLQCMQGQSLLASYAPEKIVNINGWQIFDPAQNKIREVNTADELLQSEAGVYDERLMRGNVVEKNGATIIPISDVSKFEKGDTFVVKRNYQLYYGHTGNIIDKWTDDKGRVFVKIFDVNYNSDGRARIMEVTDENMYQVLAGLPAGERGSIYAIRMNTKLASAGK